MLAWQAASGLRRDLASVVRRLPPQRTFAAAETLAAAETPAAALLALAIARQAGPEAAWSAGWRGLVRTLRRHPDPDVRQAALDLFTSPE